MVDKLVQEKLFELRNQFFSQLAARVAGFHLQWEKACNLSDDHHHLHEFQRQLHNLRGIAGLYGCPELGEVASEVESLLSSPDQAGYAIDTNKRQAVTRLLEKLTVVSNLCIARSANLFHAEAGGHANLKINLSEKPVIFIVDDDEDYCSTLRERLKQYGDCHAFYSQAAFITAINQHMPSAVIMDMMLPEGELAGAGAVVELMKKYRVPVLFLSVRDDEVSRLAAVRAGANGYFLKQDDPARMVAMLDLLITRKPQNPYKLLLIDDDVELTAYYQIKLESVGIQISVMNTAVGAIAKLSEILPDIILLDISMPEINGLEIGALIRQYPDFNHIPIIYLSASSGESIHLEAMRLGGDEFLNKPVEPDFLCNLLLARLARVRVTRMGEMHLQDTLRELGHLQQGINRHAIVSMADMAGRIIFANDKFSEVSGYAVQELIGQNHRILKSGLHPQEFYQEMWRCISSGKIWNGEIANRNKDGNLYWVVSTIIPILDDYGIPQKYLSVRTDVTPIKQLGEQLATGRNKLSLALSATHTGIWEWNLNSNETLYDSNWCGLLGYEEGRHPSWPELIHPDDFEECSTACVNMINEPHGNYHSEHRKLNKSGGWDWVHESGSVVERDTMGNPSRIMGTLQIINDRKEAEIRSEILRDQLSQSAKMESVGHLAAGIAHDFNNILGAMMGYIEMSLMMLDKKEISAEKLEKYLRMMMTSGTRAKELVAQMLTFSRLSPEGDMQKVPVILISTVIKEIVSLLHSSIPSSININYRLETEDLRVCIQPVHLHRIILNLGLNARDSIGDFGKLDIMLARYNGEEVFCTSCNNKFSGSYAKIVVKDSGKGIPEHIIKKIFDPFFTTKEVGKGTGMGLSVVHGLVHGLGGHILVESDAKNGTEFSILLPLVTAEVDNTDHPAELGPPIDIKGVRILVVDDEKGMTTMLFEFMSMFGAEITVCNDPLLALEIFSGRPDDFDLLITDETMPGISGIHLSEKILKQKPGFPIILCTGYGATVTEEKVKSIGISSLFFKPLKMNELVAKVQNLLKDRNLEK